MVLTVMGILGVFTIGHIKRTTEFPNLNSELSSGSGFEVQMLSYWVLVGSKGIH